MAHITIPFKPEMAELTLKGLKVCTTRTKRYGQPGDTFDVAGHRFEIVAVDSCALETVAEKYFRAEGFESSEAFIAYWTKLHPRRGFVSYLRVYVHWYRPYSPNVLLVGSQARGQKPVE